MTVPDQSLVRRLANRPTHWLKSRIARNVQAAVGGSAEDLVEYEEPSGDPGLLGPDSPAWIVHGDLATMLYGGFAALMLQTLNPRAMAGVAQHSNYRNDPTGRLTRTARFVAGTTFGPTPFVERLISEVLAVHGRVKGTTSDGIPYSAADPDLVTWVHITEVRHFLRSYQRYGPNRLSRDLEDRYFDDVSTIPMRLGATYVPRSVDEVERYFAQMRGELRVTSEALEAVHFLGATSLPTGQGSVMTYVNNIAHRIVVGAAIDLLPDYAREQLGLDRWHRLKVIPRRLGAVLFGKILRWALGPSQVAKVSRERIERGDPRHASSAVDSEMGMGPVSVKHSLESSAND
ncbi:MAG TPA: oxygenase MpaB family protein [Acidimicrobiales bacterium]|nr:oxygenase MpaB family protein [Acidimicrobiales bacterium]